MKPLIGMNLDIYVGPPRKIGTYVTYHEAIIASGGIPLLLPPLPESDLDFVLDKLDGVMLIGGDDYSPSLYGEEPYPTIALMDAQREAFDLALIRHLMKRPQMPVLGLCAGEQLMNIVFGGSLIQNIKTDVPQSAVKHVGEAGWKVKDWHEVQFESGSKLIDIYKKQRLNVPTAHNQGVKVVGKGLKASAFTDDGVVEAVEAVDYNFMIGVEWHPERDLAGNKALFDAFIAAAQK